MSRRQFIIGVLLVLTLIAAWFAPDPQEAVVVSAVHTNNNRNMPEVAKQRFPVANTKTIEVLVIKPRLAEEVDLPLFFSTQWEKPLPVMKTEPESVPEPQAPPLPFKVFGRYIENGVTGFFLSHNDQNLVVHKGDTIIDLYKFEGENEGALHFLYLPLKIQQTLAIGTPK